ncbi:MAG: glycoside hydrolase family 15 protein [Polyangiaceae bacterium]|nr:glycoside hydrolase family 15 protein [Polyangiaceae bacterium]MCB9606259.1 glycoside hydrolase family 15 protein [Polyangiaceae bacterium]
MKHALIGNCSYQALIDDRGAVSWLCWPRFDSSFVFGSLLDSKRGGEFSVQPRESEFQTEQDYLPNTNILRTVFSSESGRFELIDFAPRYKQYDRSFKPNMLVRRLRPLDGRPSVKVACHPVYDYGEKVPASYVASNHVQWQVDGGPLRLTTNVPLAYLLEERPFLLTQETYVVLTWGNPLEAALEETCETFFSRTRKYWETWVKHTNLPGIFQREVIRSALALKLHQYEDTGAITAATTTSIPEHAGSGRNWDYRYCWLRDTYFTLHAMRRLGHFEEMERFVSFAHNIAEGTAALQPVYGISGESRLSERTLDHLAGYKDDNQPVRVGNAAYLQVQNDVYGEIIAAIAPQFLDLRFDTQGNHEHRAALVHRLLGYIEHTMELPDAGIWEYRAEPEVHTFPLLFHWIGAALSARIGKSIADPALEGRALGLVARARSIIEEQCYRPELGFYAESTSPSNNNADASLFMMVNMGYLKRGDARAERHVRELYKRLSVDRYLMKRYNHFDGIGETLSTFTVCGFWAAEALARLGYREEAIEACEQLIKHANHVGLFSEDIDPQNGEQWGNFPQTYSHVGLINAAFAIRQSALDLLA